MEFNSNSKVFKEETTMVTENLSSRPVLPKIPVQHERKLKRQIANSNERKRMQTINAGFQSLRLLLPNTSDEKLSKAAILQQAVDYITSLLTEKQQLLALHSSRIELVEKAPTSPKIKRIKCEDDVQVSSVEATCLPSTNYPSNMYEEKESLKHRTIDRFIRKCNQQKHFEEQAKEMQNKSKVSRSPLQPAQNICRRPSDEVTSTSNIPVDRLEDQHPIPCFSTFQHSMPSNSLSRRNLDTIVEAIRHLEGDGVLYERDVACNVYVGHSEDSERDSCSDHDDFGGPTDKKRLAVSLYCDFTPSCY